MSEGRATVERDFGVLVAQSRAKLYEVALNHLRAILGPQWSTRTTDLARSGKLATKSAMFFATKGEYDVPLTINTRGNQIKILLESGGTFDDLQELAAELERVVRMGRAPTHVEWAEAEAARRNLINKKRGHRKNKPPIDEKAELRKITAEQAAASLSVAQTPPPAPKPKAKPEPITYLQTDFEKLMKEFDGQDNAKKTPLSDDQQIRTRRISVLHVAQGAFRRAKDHLRSLPEPHDNVFKFFELLQDKINSGEMITLEQYTAMCRLISMLIPEIIETRPPEYLQTSLNRLADQTKVF